MGANIKLQQINGCKHKTPTNQWVQTQNPTNQWEHPQNPNKSMGANTKPQQINGSKHKPQQINGCKHKTPTNQWVQTQNPNKTMGANTKPQQINRSNNKQCINNNITTALEWTYRPKPLGRGAYLNFTCQIFSLNSAEADMSRDMRFPTMWYVWPVKAQTSLR